MCFCGHKAKKQSCPKLAVSGGKILVTRIFKHHKMANKTKIIKMRVTEKQDAVLRAAADKAGLSLSEYIRRKTLKGEVGVMDSLAFLREYNKYVLEISKIGNNINQLARYANMLNIQGTYSKDVIDEMTIQLRQLTQVEIKIEEITSKILKA